MLKTAHTKQQQAPRIVIVEPTLTRLRVSRWLMLIGGGIMLLGIVAIVISSLFDKSNPFPGSFFPFYVIFYFVYAVFMLFFFTRLYKFWERLERRRQIAAAGDPSLLAAQQPRPDADALPVPTVIGEASPAKSNTSLRTTFKQRPNWKVFLIILGSFFVGMIVIAVLFFVFFPTLFPPLPHHHTLPSIFVIIVIAVFVVLMLLYGGLLFGVMYFKARQHLTVTENGLMMFGFLKVHSVPWQEAKLFAIDGLFGAKRYPHPTIFELSSANDIVRWTWMRRSSFRVVFYARPVLSEEEYNRQMESLLSFIAARTGLPLYDLRDKRGA
ncbi:MAG TPA: hypothetical protein VFA09_00030 [Ktedonobacteraceae bacterium]|nr:hypothetical protein [Ktedonobacteraceae bacterium]